MKSILFTLFLMFNYQVFYAQLNWKKVESGGEFSIALRSDSTIWAWGFNGNGQLGINSTATEMSPVLIDSNKYVDIAVGAFHSFAIKVDGSLWSWGFNQFGQLGIGNFTQSQIPVQVGTDYDWFKIEAGQAHNLALKQDSSLYTWGLGFNGCLGDSSEVDKSSPVAILPSKKWISISAGGLHSAAIDSDNNLWTWGDNSLSQLGDSTITDYSIVPVKVSYSGDWEEVSCGHASNIAKKTNNTIWSWGFNGNGQLGLGHLNNINVPHQIGNNNDWKTIEAGSTFGFAIKQDSTMYGWGFNGSGQLGLNSTMQFESPKSLGNEKYVLISAATGFEYNNSVYGLHSLALKKDKNSICTAGANYGGQLGDGTLNEAHIFTCNTGLIIGFDELTANNNSTKIYPNPGSDIINISSETSIYEITIFDSQGKKIKHVSATGDYDVKIDISSLKPSLYLIRVQGKNNIEIMHFLKI